MIKSELIQHIGQKMLNVPEKEIAKLVNKLLECLSETLQIGKRIEIRGFGSFEVRHRRPRNAHNPKTGMKVVTQPKNRPHFKPGKELRERVNASRNEFPIIVSEDNDED